MHYQPKDLQNTGTTTCKVFIAAPAPKVGRRGCHESSGGEAFLLILLRISHFGLYLQKVIPTKGTEWHLVARRCLLCLATRV